MSNQVTFLREEHDMESIGGTGPAYVGDEEVRVTGQTGPVGPEDIAIDERRTVELLAEKLELRNKRLGDGHEQYLGQVLRFITPSKSPKIYSMLESIYGGLFPPFQPDVDILFRKGDDIRAVEVKVFHLNAAKTLSRSYYEGLDQALALLRLGFNRVALWHIFDMDIELVKFVSYGSSMQIFVRQQLRLPLDFTAMYIAKDNGGYRFVPTQPLLKDRETGQLITARSLRAIDDPLLPFVWETNNPLLKDELVAKTRTAMLEWLGDR
jgi:hypothetical protein